MVNGLYSSVRFKICCSPMSLSLGLVTGETFGFGAGGSGRAWIGLAAQQLCAILRRARRCLALRRLTREDQNRCAYEKRPSQGKFREILRTRQSWDLCEALEFPSQAELTSLQIIDSVGQLIVRVVSAFERTRQEHREMTPRFCPRFDRRRTCR